MLLSPLCWRRLRGPAAGDRPSTYSCSILPTELATVCLYVQLSAPVQAEQHKNMSCVMSSHSYTFGIAAAAATADELSAPLAALRSANRSCVQVFHQRRAAPFTVSLRRVLQQDDSTAALGQAAAPGLPPQPGASGSVVTLHNPSPNLAVMVRAQPSNTTWFRHNAWVECRFCCLGPCHTSRGQWQRHDAALGSVLRQLLQHAPRRGAGAEYRGAWPGSRRPDRRSPVVEFRL